MSVIDYALDVYFWTKRGYDRPQATVGEILVAILQRDHNFPIPRQTEDT